MVQRVPVERQHSPRTPFEVTQLVENGADAAQVAEVIVSIWKNTGIALAPLIGLGGLAMLYKRSLHLVAPLHPWLADPPESAPRTIDLSHLEAMLAQRDSAEAAAAGIALLHTFQELLATLIGRSLTERLLRSTWATAPPGPTPQDTAP